MPKPIEEGWRRREFSKNDSETMGQRTSCQKQIVRRFNRRNIAFCKTIIFQVLLGEQTLDLATSGQYATIKLFSSFQISK